jgi:hypothetical protein
MGDYFSKICFVIQVLLQFYGSFNARMVSTQLRVPRQYSGFSTRHCHVYVSLVNFSRSLYFGPILYSHCKYNEIASQQPDFSIKSEDSEITGWNVLKNYSLVLYTMVIRHFVVISINLTLKSRQLYVFTYL